MEEPFFVRSLSGIYNEDCEKLVAEAGDSSEAVGSRYQATASEY
jgi:hypothetical protein